MKKTIPTFFITIILLSASCKKGKDDPWLSFRSRDNRLMGKWEITFSERKRTMHWGPNDLRIELETFNNGQLKWKSIYNDTFTEEFSKYYYKTMLEIKDNGVFIYIEKPYIENVLDSTEYNVGTWVWGNTNKTKSCVSFGFDQNTSVFYSNFYRIDKLSNNELKLSYKNAANTLSKNKSGQYQNLLNEWEAIVYLRRVK